MTTPNEVDAGFSEVVPTTPASSGVVPIFTCSSSNGEGSGSLAITEEAVYLGEDSGIVRIGTSEIRAWYTDTRETLFALTVVSDRQHETLLFPELRTAVTGVLTRTIGPEHRIALEA